MIGIDATEERKCGLARSAFFHLEGRKIQTPVLWISYEFFNPPNLWKQVRGVEGLLVNVHNINQRKDLLTKLNQGRRLRRIVDFRRHLMLDCGGVKFLNGNASYQLRPIINLCRKVNPDIVVGADYPISPSMGEYESRLRIMKTLKNLKEIVKEINPTYELMPVIHGYTIFDIDKMINWIERVSPRFRCYGIGSLVPLLVPFTIRKCKRIVDLIIYVRKKLPNVFLHVFGMGSVLMMHIALLLGVDSLDSQSWVRSAGYGKIQIPGKGQRFVKRNEERFQYSQWSRQVDWDSYKCDCPICNKRNFKKMLSSSKTNRAIHNAQVFCSEALLAKRLIKEGEYLPFVRDRLKNTCLWSLLKYVENRLK